MQQRRGKIYESYKDIPSTDEFKTMMIKTIPTRKQGSNFNKISK